MAPQKKEGIEGVGLRLPSEAIRKLKVLAAERGVSLSSIAEEAFGLWWSQQPESKIKGPLFPGVAIAPPETTPKVTQVEQSTPKPEEKTAQAGSVNKGNSQKTPEKKAKKK